MPKTIPEAMAQAEQITKILCNKFGFASNFRQDTSKGLWGTSIKKNEKSWIIFFHVHPKNNRYWEMERYKEEDREEVFNFLDEVTSCKDWSLQYPT